MKVETVGLVVRVTETINIKLNIGGEIVALGGIVVSVLATGPKVRGFKPGF
jgi:hypothetical protein